MFVGRVDAVNCGLVSVKEGAGWAYEWVKRRAAVAMRRVVVAVILCGGLVARR